jgi:hypothetical protein
LKIEPRPLPNRNGPAEIVARLAPSAPTMRRVDSTLPSSHRQRRSHRVRRFAMPAIFLAALVALVVAIVQFDRDEDALKAASGAGTAGDGRVSRRFPDGASPVSQQASAVPAPAVATPGNPSAVAPEGLTPPVSPEEPARPGAGALKTLVEFLDADTLAARLPLIETNTPPEELAASCLAGTLPYKSIETTIQAANEAGSVIDCYFRVGFERGQGRELLQTILVQIRGAGPPRVVVDPLLDLYGGRLAAYAAKPTDKPGYFQVILCALSLPPANWPNADSKFTVKLQSDDKEDGCIAVAVADKQSGIGKALNDSVITGLRWGQHKPCQVMLQWNLENPSKPYLEALNVKRFDWNP